MTGEKSVTFKVVRIPITADDVALSPTRFTYDGEPHEPSVTVTVDGRVLSEGSDYTVSYLGDKTSVGPQVIEIVTPKTSVYASAATASYVIEEAEGPVAATWERLYGASALDTMGAEELWGILARERV